VAQICHRGAPKNALGTFDEEAIGAHLLEHQLDVLQVLGPSGAINQNVVKENQNEFPNVGLEDHIHQRLKCSQHVRQFEQHDRELAVALMSMKGHLLNVIWMHLYLMVAPSYIDLCEIPRAMQFVKKFIDDWDGKFIFYCLLIQSPIVDTKTPTAICLFHQQHCLPKWRGRMLNDALSQNVSALSLHLILQ
jgi:hypothetical protein